MNESLHPVASHHLPPFIPYILRPSGRLSHQARCLKTSAIQGLKLFLKNRDF